MARRWFDTFSLAQAAGKLSAAYVVVSNSANISVSAGVLKFASTGGVIDVHAAGGDCTYGNSYVQAKIAAFGTNSILRLRLRSDGTNYAQLVLNLTTGAWTLGTQAGAGAGSGTVDAPPAVGDTFRLEITGTTTGTLTFKHDAGTTGTFSTEGTDTATVTATGRAGAGITAVAGDLDDLDCGPLVAMTRTAPNGGAGPRTRLVAMMSTSGGTGGDATANTKDTLWASGWETWLAEAGELDSIIARGYRRVMAIRLGENPSGVTFAADHSGAAFIGVPLSPRFFDHLLHADRCGFATPTTDRRLNDGLVTALSARIALLDEFIAYITPPPNGQLAGQSAWGTTDNDFEMWVSEWRQMGASLAFDILAGCNPAHANSDGCRKFLDYLFRTRPSGERVYCESHLDVQGSWTAALRAPFTTPPWLSSTFKCGPMDGYLSAGNGSTEIFDRLVGSEKHIWYGPGDIEPSEHMVVLNGSIAVATRYAVAASYLQQGFTVVMETASLTAAQDQELQHLGRLTRSGRRRGRARRGVRR